MPTAVPNLTSLPGANAFPGVPTLGRGIAGVRRRLGLESHDPAVLEATTARPPKTSFNGPISGHRRFSFGQLSLDTVKEIKNEAGVSVNDVVVSLCAGALRDWMKDRDELPSKPLVAMVPVSVRTEDEMGAFGNRISMMIVPIATDEADPKRRLRRTHELLSGAKERHRATPANLLTDATSFIPPAVASLAARTMVEVMGRTRPPLNVVISNVPGPRSPLFLAGAKLEAHYPVSVVIDGVGLNITVMSYLDHLDFGIVADRDQVDDVWTLIDRLSSALDELTSAVLGKAAVRRTKRAAAQRAKTASG